MPIYLYKTDFGPFSVLIDDTIIHAQSVVIEQLHDVIGLLCISVDNYSPTPYLSLTNKIPKITLKKVNPTATSYSQAKDEAIKYYIDETRSVLFGMWYYNKIEDLGIISNPYINENVVYGSDIFYGKFGPQRSGATNPDYITFNILVSNSTFTSFGIAIVSVVPDGTINVGYLRQSASQNLKWAQFLDNLPHTEVPVNPYDPGGNSGEGGGGGSFDNESDLIPDSSLPTLSAADTGFTRLYTPTLSQVQNLARYLWTDESIIDTLWNVVKRYFEDPMQAFISFSIVPVPVPVAGQEEFKVLFIPTGVMLNTVANQFVDVDCGTFELKEYYGSALDYSPNTKVSCYLPYIGTVSLNTDDVMGRTLQVKYRVDICSGSCVAKILVDGNVIYQFPGCCAVPIPFSSSDFSSYGSAIISAVKTGVAVAAAGMGMPEVGANIVGMNAGQQTGDSYTKTVKTTERNPATGRQITTGTQTTTKEVNGTKASLSGIAQTGISNTANSVTASKTIVERSGSFSGNSGYLGVRRPYLIIERPRMCMPANYQTLNGFPSMITLELSSCKGYTRVQQVQLTGVEATNPEQAEILELLKGGVIF